MKISGKVVAEAILSKLKTEVVSKNLHPRLAIILANKTEASRIYIRNKIIAAKKINIGVKLYEFLEQEQEKCLQTIQRLNRDKTVDGMIIQYPVYGSWNFDELEKNIDLNKDVDGFLDNSPYFGATALGIWEMLTAFALMEGYKKTEEFLKGKKIVLLGRGKAAGGPTLKLLHQKGFQPEVIEKETENPSVIIREGEVIISATGVKNIVNKNNLKKGAYVVGVGMGREVVDGKEKIYGDIKESDVAKIAKLYCPTIGGIGPLTIVSLLKNVIESAGRNK